MLKNNVGGTLVRLGRQIRRMRESAGMTPVELARKLRVSKDVVSRIEKGQDDMLLDTLFKIARIFGRSLKFRVVARR